MSVASSWMCNRCGRVHRQGSMPGCCENCGGTDFTRMSAPDEPSFFDDVAGSDGPVQYHYYTGGSSGGSSSGCLVSLFYLLDKLFLIVLLIGVVLYFSNDSFKSWAYEKYHIYEAYVVMWFSSPLPEDMDMIKYVRIAAEKADAMYPAAEQEYWKKVKLSKPGYWLEATVTDASLKNRPIKYIEETCSYHKDGVYKVYCQGRIRLVVKGNDGYQDEILWLNHGGFVKLKYTPSGKDQWFGHGPTWTYLGFEEPECVAPYSEEKVQQFIKKYSFPKLKRK